MNIVFATSGLEFNGESLKQGSLGGSETAVLCMARELYKLGNRVAVYCRTRKPGTYDGVHYRSIDNFVYDNKNLAIDVLIVSRFGSLWSPAVDGALNVYWLHDMPQKKEEFLPYTLKADKIFVLSDYHREQYMGMSEHLDKVLTKTSNGVDMDAIHSASPAPRNQASHRFMYSSLPERGLHPLLKNIWPEIKKRLPAAELVVAGYDITSVSKSISPDVMKVREQCGTLIQADPSVTAVGSLNKNQLYSLMKSSDALLYPCFFPEIFCITAIEAQACGVPIVTTDDYALKETVGIQSGVLVSGKDQEYVRNFADEAVNVAKDGIFKELVAQYGPDWVKAKGFEWRKIAASWNKMFEEELNSRVNNNLRGVISASIKRRDLVVADYLEKKLPNIPQESRKSDVLLLNKASNPVPVKMLNDVDIDVLWELAHGIFKQVHKGNGKPKISLLEYCCTEKPFSVYFVENSENANATVIVEDAIELEKLKAKYTDDRIRFISKGEALGLRAEGKKFDCIFLGSYISHVSTPGEKAWVMTNDLKAKGGVVVSATPHGPVAMSEYEADNQKWSFDIDDLQNLFGTQEDFSAAFAHLYVGKKGEKLGYWVSYYVGDQKPGKITLLNKARRIRPDQTLTACVIAKNEQKWIGMCLSEIHDLVDEIIVGDCRSTDGTKEVAKMFDKVKIVDIDFEDFSQTRNITLDNANGDWILIVDCDERLVNSEGLNKFLHFTMPEGYAIRQNHLTVDNTPSHDSPIRLFRNRPNFRYVGKIHEHIANVSEEEFGASLGATYDIGDVDIAHYGYVNERVRKEKVVLRNMDLLIEDAIENLPKGRVLVWLLAIRDYMNAIKWHQRRIGEPVITAGSFEHFLAECVIKTYHGKFRDAESKYHDKIFVIYQEAMTLLGRNRINFSDTKSVPFQVAISLLADYEPMNPSILDELQPTCLWFLHPEELRLYLDRSHNELSKKMFREYNRPECPKWDYNPEVPDPVETLRAIRDQYKRIG